MLLPHTTPVSRTDTDCVKDPRGLESNFSSDNRKKYKAAFRDFVGDFVGAGFSKMSQRFERFGQQSIIVCSPTANLKTGKNAKSPHDPRRIITVCEF